MRLDKKMQARVIAKLEEIALRHPHRQAKKLSGHDEIYRVRVGLYRVVYEYDDGVIFILRVRHRSKVYEGM